MEPHPYQKIDYNYLRPPRKFITKKSKEEEFTCIKGEISYRNIYYGVQIPDEERQKTNEYNLLIKDEIRKGTLKVPEFWSFHDSWRFADAAAYYKPDMIKDAINHMTWVENLKGFR